MLCEEVNKHLDDAKFVCPDISRNIINRAMTIQCTSVLNKDDECRVVSNENENENENENYDDSRQKGWRHVKSSIVLKYETELRHVKVRNNISIKYTLEKSPLLCGKGLSRGYLGIIIDDVTSKHSLDSSDISYSTIRSRGTWSNNITVNRIQGGHISPMAKVEDKLVGLIIQMTHIRYPLTPSSYLQFANNLIFRTQVGKRIINFKEKYCFMNEKEGKRLLWRNCWNLFKQRSCHLIVSKRGRKYEMDRDKLAYRNFSDIYYHVIEEMCGAGVAEKLYSPMWVNRDGEEYQPSELLGCKVIHHIKYSDICIVCDEVRWNSSQKGDGLISGTLHVCERDFTLQYKTSNKKKRLHWWN